MIFNNIIFDLPFWRQNNNRSQSYCPAWNILKTKKYMDVKTTVFKPGAADHWRQQPWEMGNKCCRPCVCLLTVWELPGRPSCRRQEPSPSWGHTMGSEDTKSAGFCRASARGETIAQRKPQGLEQDDDQLRDVKKAPMADERTSQNEWKEQHPTITKGQKSSAPSRHWGTG